LGFGGKFPAGLESFFLCHHGGSCVNQLFDVENGLWGLVKMDKKKNGTSWTSSPNG